tara:strand:- start:399 stop:1643 length:1245 start_codon:yes stop_codon:yes gene_type:complete
MATFKFVLSKSQHQKKNNSNQSMLFLRYTHKKRVTYFTTSKNIDDKYWDAKNQQIKRSYPGSDRFNILIKKIRQRVEDIANGILIEGDDPMPNIVKQQYQEKKDEQNKKTQYTFFEYANKYIEDSKKHKKHGTIKTYTKTINKLHQYEKYARVHLDWHNIDIDFYYDFIEYYTQVLGFTNNGFGGLIKVIKAILNDATEKGYNTHNGHLNKGFKAIKEEVNNIYLSDEELQRIIDLNLSYDKQLERVRDLFIVGCYTGLRFSDFSQIKKESFIGNILQIKTLKTGQWVKIPVMQQVLDVIAKYEDQPNGLPKSCQNQTMNKHLKEIGRKAKIDEMILKIRNRGKQRIETSIPKYKLISTHTARRSFATNMFKRGVPSRVIMAVTGHSTERAFSSYIKISKDENAELMLRYLEIA